MCHREFDEKTVVISELKDKNIDIVPIYEAMSNMQTCKEVYLYIEQLFANHERIESLIISLSNLKETERFYWNKKVDAIKMVEEYFAHM